MALSKANIFQIPINSSPSDELLNQIIVWADKPAGPRLVFTPNPEFLVVASRNPEFKRLLTKADMNIPDGIGLVWWSRLLGWGIRQRVSGAGMVSRLLSIGQQQHWRVGVAGARRSEARESQELLSRLRRRYPGLELVNLDQASAFPRRFNLVLACHGMVRQERWLWQNRKRLPANVLFGVGSSLDYLTNFSRRAPFWLRRVGLEWLWRVVQNPGHIKRAWRAVVSFSWLVIKDASKRFFGLDTQ